MISTWRRFRSFPRPIRLLQINQAGINLGFFLLMPYLAQHLTGQAHLAVWAVGLILGLRNASQQGLFLIGGTLADRLGYKPMIMAGCVLRTAGFALFGLSTSLPFLLIAAVLSGLAGALFNPAARAYLAHEAGDRKVEAFAVFNVFYQAGILAGPLLGLALLGAGFRTVCFSAAAIFAVLAVLQWRCLPARRGAEADAGRPVLHDWREACTNRPFLAFATAMIASYALSYQMYLGLPLEVQRVGGGAGGVMVLYVISGLIGIAGQVPVTAWCSARWSSGQCIAGGLALMTLAFAPLAITAPLHPPPYLALAPVIVCTLLLTFGTLLAFPFEMATVADVGGGRLIGTYYGLYNLLSGAGILAGNLASGAAIDLAGTWRLPGLPWLLLICAGLASTLAVTRLHRTGRLTPARPAHPAVPAG
ncbi:putative ABC transporter, permease protein [Sphaerisporangium melleum]|uniref:ABC transporter, permease protein n=1 Tax=Sphaerisporangium melleum TaxID=321316 RepID=A0A917VM02_9ACTN|nr:MFS transporter [Sphaerisporangium melleum]GGK94493.1 putative ABC transporter, permease protein [Sphaerisporangium melleum]GII73250.1 putative ABC transporter, permease protein [Sphaerisporangium melleum]